MSLLPVTLELPDGIVRLEPLTMAHGEALLAALNEDAQIWRYLPTTPPTSPSAMEEFIDAALTRASGGNEFPFAVVRRDTGEAIGSTRYLDIQPEHRGVEIGWTWLARSWQRTRANTECKFLLLRHAFEQWGAIRVQLKTDSRNEQSQRAILRIGARYEGCLRRQRILHDGHERDSVYFSVITDEWPRVKANLERRLTEQNGSPAH
ncbi:MAG: GNAT family protein [Phycisphaerae bacterium]